MPLTITKPTVGSSLNAWGSVLNAALDAVKAFVDKLEASRNRVDVKADLGAACDGVTDDWPKVRLALAAGGEVIVPAGTHLWKLTATPVTTPANTTLTLAPGAVVLLDSDVAGADREFLVQGGNELTVRGPGIIRRNSACGIVFFGVRPYEGLTLTDVTLDGQSSVHGIVHGAHLIKTGQVAGVAKRIRMDRCVVKGMHFGWLQVTADTGQTTDIRITDCTFSGNYGDDLEFNGPQGAISNVRVVNCTFENNQSVVSSYGFAVGAATVTDIEVRGCRASGYFNEAFHFEDYCRGVRVLDNHLSNISTGATQWISVLSGCSDVRIEGNTARVTSGTGNGAVVTMLAAGSGTTPSGGTYAPPSDVRIRRNTFLCQDGMTGVYADGVSQLDVSKNRIRSTGVVTAGYYSGPATSAIVASNSADRIAITDNEISGFTYGLYPQSGATRNLGDGYRVAGNTFRDVKLGIGATNVGDGTIMGNDFRNCENSVIASWDTAVQGNVHLTDNHAQGCTNPMGIYGTCAVVASAARTVGSPVTGSVYAICNMLPVGTIIRWSGGGVMTLTATAGFGATSVTGNLVTAAVANGEQGVAYFPWSSSASKAATVRQNSDDKLGVWGYGAKIAEPGGSYSTKGHEDLVLFWSVGAVATLQPSSHCAGRMHSLSNVGGTSMTVVAVSGSVLGGASYTLPASTTIRVISDGGSNWLAA